MSESLLLRSPSAQERGAVIPTVTGVTPLEHLEHPPVGLVPSPPAGGAWSCSPSPRACVWLAPDLRLDALRRCEEHLAPAVQNGLVLTAHDQRTVETTLELHGLVAARPLGLDSSLKVLRRLLEETSVGVAADASRHRAMASGIGHLRRALQSSCASTERWHGTRCSFM